MNEAIVVAAADPAMRSAVEIRARVNRIQEVMRAVMKDKVHYGLIPGCDKPSLWKPGAEVLFSTFRIAVRQEIDDLSSQDEIRYRVNATATDAQSGAYLGSAYGECSSSEEKYRWRRVVCQEEWEATPEDRRRVKWARGREGAYSVQQIRTVPADVANTVLKMAAKRAEIALCLRVTAASDIFTQDIEDLPEELRENLEPGAAPSPEKKAEMPKRASEAAKPAPAPRAAQAATLTPVKIKSVQDKEMGQGGKERPYKITTTTGKVLSTYSETHANAARDALELSGSLLVAFHEDQYGLKLDHAELAPPSAPGA